MNKLITADEFVEGVLKSLDEAGVKAGLAKGDAMKLLRKAYNEHLGGKKVPLMMNCIK